MFERIKTLVILQWTNKSKKYEKLSKRKYASLSIQGLITILITIAMTFILYFVKSFLFIPTTVYLLIVIILITQLINIIVAIIGLTNDLYHSKDNQILFSLPVKSDEVFISKMVVYYIYEFIRNIYFILPILIAFGVINKLNFLYYFNIIPVIIILPILSVGIATLISIPISFIKNYLKEKPIFVFLISIVFVAVLFYLTYLLVSSIPTPIRIVQLYNQFIITLTKSLYKIASFGTIYSVIGYFLYQLNYFINLLILLGTVIIIIGLNYFISKPIYFNLMSSSNENSIKKSKKKNPTETKTMFSTFLNKEITIARRTPNELLNNYGTLLTLPFFMYVLNYIYMGINSSTLGNQLILVFNIIIVLLLVTSSNTASATAITTEGYEFVLLKTAPYNTSKMAWAKITFNIIFTVIIIGISFIIFGRALTVFPKTHILLLFLFVTIVNIGHILSSFQIDLLNPKLSDYATQGTLSHNDNVSKSIALGLGLSLVFGLLALFLFIFLRGIAWYVLIGLASILTVYRFIMFQRHLNAYFVDIEY